MKTKRYRYAILTPHGWVGQANEKSMGVDGFGLSNDCDKSERMLTIRKNRAYAMAEDNDVVVRVATYEDEGDWDDQ